MRSIGRLARLAGGPVLGVVLLGAVGSCELPKPQIPSIGRAAPAHVVRLQAPPRATPRWPAPAAAPTPVAAPRMPTLHGAST